MLWGMERLACYVIRVYASVGLCRCGVPKAWRGVWRATTKSCGAVGMFSYAIDTIDNAEGARSTLCCGSEQTCIVEVIWCFVLYDPRVHWMPIAVDGTSRH